MVAYVEAMLLHRLNGILRCRSAINGGDPCALNANTATQQASRHASAIGLRHVLPAQTKRTLRIVVRPPSITISSPPRTLNDY